MSNLLSVIDAFIDNEPVSVHELRSALADPSGREYLTDVLAVRGLVLGDPSAAIDPHRPGARVSAWSARSWVAVAALLAIVAGLVGYTAGQRSERTTPVIADSAAPTPTQVIRLRPGVDWTERSGGN